jgi:hypothetical protein
VNELAGTANFTAKSSRTNVTFISQASSSGSGGFGPFLDNVQVFEVSDRYKLFGEPRSITSSGAPQNNIYNLVPALLPLLLLLLLLPLHCSVSMSSLFQLDKQA